MSGYDLSRFVDLSESDSEELTCIICREIFRNPVVANCCLQTFCKQCINNWLETNNTCPYDRKELNRSRLSLPSRAFSNMLGKLKIRCIYNKNGCKEILLLDNLENHEKTCSFDKPFCDKCFSERSVNHECIKSLLESKQKLVEANNQLKKELGLANDKILSMQLEVENLSPAIEALSKTNKDLGEQLQSSDNEISSLNSEISNYLQTIQDLIIANETNCMHNSSKEVVFNISDQQILDDARKYLNSPVIDSEKASKEMTDRIISIAKNAIVDNDGLYEVCQSIIDKVQSEFDDRWNCNALYNDIGENYYWKNDQFIVNIRFGKLIIEVYRVTDGVDIRRLGKLLRSNKVKEEFKDIKANVDKDTYSVFEKITIHSLKTCNDLNEVCNQINNSLTEKFGGVWHCFVFKQFLGHYTNWFKKRKYINLNISNLSFVIFEISD